MLALMQLACMQQRVSEGAETCCADECVSWLAAVFCTGSLQCNCDAAGGQHTLCALYAFVFMQCCAALTAVSLLCLSSHGCLP